MSERRDGNVRTWGALLDDLTAKAETDGDLAAAIDRFIGSARETLAKPLVRRVYRYEDVGKHRTHLDGRARPLEPEIQETFALAMSDTGTNGAMAAELPLLASAYRTTGEQCFLERLLEQLDEMASWSPLQRPGWTCYRPGHRLPADGKGDGNWLATGAGVRAIADMLEILPDEALPSALRARLDELLAKEIASIVDDWRARRPWFVRTDNALTNQWMLPTEGLVRACLVLGTDRHAEAYDLAMKNFFLALDSRGSAGEFEEGVAYANGTVASMLHAARAMAVTGDRRAIDHPFLANFPMWFAHHLQPGGFLISCFDAGSGRGGGDRLAGLCSLFVAHMGSAPARWVLSTQAADGYPNNLPGLAARAYPAVGDECAPPLFAAYERATMVNWRDGWNDDANGVWVRGGHETDQHDHYDRGHVNLIFNGKPILIEASTPPYHNKQMRTHYQPYAGHNVLDLGSGAAQKDVAPMAVARLDESGGEVTVDGAACYPGVQRWERHVQWNSQHLIVNDTVELEADKQDEIIFRWHLGTCERVHVEGEGAHFTVEWPDARMTLTGSQPLVVTQEEMPDNTLGERSWDDDSPDPTHTCIVVRPAGGTTSLSLSTTVSTSHGNE